MPRKLFGLDLSEVKFSKFSAANTFNAAYHLRRTKMSLYQLALLLSACANSLGQTVLIKYLQSKTHPLPYITSTLHFPPPYLFIYNLSPSHTQLDITPLVAVMSLNIFFAFATSALFTTAWFLDLIWPERVQSSATRTTWRALSLTLCVIGTGDVVAMTAVVLSGGVVLFERNAMQGVRVEALEPVYRYQDDYKCLLALCLLWPAWAAVVASSGAMWASHAHDEVLGVWSRVGRERMREKGRGRV